MDGDGCSLGLRGLEGVRWCKLLAGSSGSGIGFVVFCGLEEHGCNFGGAAAVDGQETDD